MASPQYTQTTDHAGNVITTSYNPDGSVATVVTKSTNADGTQVDTWRDASGNTTKVFNKDASGRTVSQVIPNSDGTTSFTEFVPGGGSKTTTVGTDGKTPVAISTEGTDGSTSVTYLNPDGTAKQPTVTKTPDQVAAENAALQNQIYRAAQNDPNNPQLSKNQGGSGNLLLNPSAIFPGVKSATKGIKNYLDSTNPVGTPGLNNTVITDDLLGGSSSGGSIFSKDAVGSLLSKYLGGGGGSGPVGGVDTGGISSAIAASQALGQKYGAAYDSATPGVAPQAQAALAQAVQAQGSAPITAAQSQGSAAVQAQQAQIAAALSAAQAQGSAPVSAVNMSPAQIAAYIEAQKGGPIAYGSVTGGHSTAAVAAPSVKADSANYNSADEMAARAEQQGLVTGLKGAIAGTDPSVAAILLRQATDRNIANQYALAASSHGIGSGLAERQAMMGAADLNSKAAADNAILRAKEITDARAQLADVLGQQRTADISTATTQFTTAQGVNNDYAGAQNTRGNLNASLANATGIANASNDTNAAVATARNLTDANTTAASLANAVEIDNANNRAAQAQKQAELTQDASKTNAGAANSANQFNASQAQQNQQFNAGQANTVGEFNIGETNKANQFNAGQANTVGLANAAQYQQNNQFNTGQANTVGQFNATQNQQNSQFNAGQANDISKVNANNQTGISQSNTTARLTQAQIDAKAKQDAAANALTASGQGITGAVGLADAQARAVEAQAKKDANTTGILTALGTAYAASDERLKTDIKPSDKEIAELLAKMKGYSYRYKDPKAPGAGEGERFGPMAQDLERSEAGKSLVRDTPNGKMVDVNAAVMTALAALAHVDKRIKKIERRA